MVEARTAWARFDGTEPELVVGVLDSVGSRLPNPDPFILRTTYRLPVITWAVSASSNVVVAATTSDGAGLRERRSTATPLVVRGSKVGGFAKSRASVTRARCSAAHTSKT